MGLLDHLKKTTVTVGDGRPAEEVLADAIYEPVEEPIPQPDPPQDQANQLPAAIVGLTIVCRCGQPQIIPVDMSGQQPPILKCTCERLFQVQNVRIAFGEAEPEKPKPGIYLPPSAGSVIPFPGRVR